MPARSPRPRRASQTGPDGAWASERRRCYCRRGRRHRANCHEAVPPRGRRGGTGVRFRDEQCDDRFQQRACEGPRTGLGGQAAREAEDNARSKEELDRLVVDINSAEADLAALQATEEEEAARIKVVEEEKAARIKAAEEEAAAAEED